METREASLAETEEKKSQMVLPVIQRDDKCETPSVSWIYEGWEVEMDRIRRGILRRINWWVVIAWLLVIGGGFGIWYAIYLFVRLIRDATLG